MLCWQTALKVIIILSDTHPSPPEGREIDMLCLSARICPISHIRPVQPTGFNEDGK